MKEKGQAFDRKKLDWRCVFAIPVGQLLTLHLAYHFLNIQNKSKARKDYRHSMNVVCAVIERVRHQQRKG
jgi:hypothetical protein